jgi:nucleoside-diphosphate-sugar epimerase
MRAVVVGTGTIGSAVSKPLKQHAHRVVAVDRKSGDFQADKNTATRFASARLVGRQETEKWEPIVSG